MGRSLGRLVAIPLGRHRAQAAALISPFADFGGEARTGNRQRPLRSYARYARGELSREDFESMRQDLQR